MFDWINAAFESYARVKIASFAKQTCSRENKLNCLEGLCEGGGGNYLLAVPSLGDRKGGTTHKKMGFLLY